MLREALLTNMCILYMYIFVLCKAQTSFARDTHLQSHCEVVLLMLPPMITSTLFNFTLVYYDRRCYYRMNHWTTARSVGFMNAGIADPELRKKKLNAECFGIAGGCWGSFVTFLSHVGWCKHNWLLGLYWASFY